MAEGAGDHGRLALLADLDLVAGGARETDAARADKSRFTLLDPTPRHLMREMTTDRPDVTESPSTVDAGHIQVELSVLDYTYDDEDGVRTDAFVILPTNVKVGLLNSVDLQLVLDPYVNVRTRPAGGRSDRAEGFGDTQFRLKVNLWGNDEPAETAGLKTVFGVMPYVWSPTADDDLGGSDHVHGGVIFPLSVELPGGFNLALMGEVDVVRDAEDEGYGIEFLHTVNLNREIAGPLGGYVEYVSIAPHDTGGTCRALVGAGLTWALSEDVQLDLGVNAGVSESADDLNLFAGLSFRL